MRGMFTQSVIYEGKLQSFLIKTQLKEVWVFMVLVDFCRKFDPQGLALHGTLHSCTMLEEVGLAWNWWSAASSLMGRVCEGGCTTTSAVLVLFLQ